MGDEWGKIGAASHYLDSKGIELRIYQLNIVNSILAHGNTLVVLPTGLGKTMIAAIMASITLSKGKKVLFLAPTKPLAEQHHTTFTKLLKIKPEELLLLIGSVNKKKREELEKNAKVIIATPQTFANDLKDATVSLEEFGCVIFDECHRAVGRYAYTYIANECTLRSVQIVGLTASPGSKKERIDALVASLNISYIEVKISSDPDVAPYVMAHNIHTAYVDLNDSIREISALLAPEAEQSLRSLNKVGLLRFRNFDTIPKGRILQAGDQIGKIRDINYRYGAMFSYTRLLNLTHAYDLLRSEGIYPFSLYFDGLEKREKKSRGIENLLKTPNLVKARALAKAAIERGEEHSKVFAVLDTLRQYRGKSVIVFAQYRSTVKMLTEFISNNGFRARPFIGKGEGVTQEIQKGIITDFRNRVFDVLIASSIAEEGLDIPSVDAVIFYEPIPNEIRNIQRKGRTGRFRDGDVYILIARNTKDEVYLQISRTRELRMMELIRSANRALALKNPVPASNSQHTL